MTVEHLLNWGLGNLGKWVLIEVNRADATRTTWDVLALVTNFHDPFDTNDVTCWTRVTEGGHVCFCWTWHGKEPPELVMEEASWETHACVAWMRQNPGLCPG